jgi:hypothetical protein
MPKESGDNKQTLIAFLVGFVLLAIILGVTTFTGYNGQTKLEEDRKKSDQERTAMQKERDKEKFLRLLAKSYMGVQDKNEATDFSGALSQYNPDSEEFKSIANQAEVARLGLRWDSAQNKPAQTMAGEITRLSTALANAQENLNKANAAIESQRVAFQTQLNEQAALLKVAQDGKSKADAALVELKGQKSQEFLETLDLKAKGDATIETVTKKMAETVDDAERKDRGRVRDLKDLQTTLDKVRDSLPKPDVSDYDRPKGKITRLDRSGKVGYIDLGSAHNVRPGLTFSVFGSAAGGKGGGKRKGAVEVADVIGERSSRVRVTEVTDPNRNPIMNNDLLFNPGWSSEQRQHVAIAGFIDLTGDGRDGSAQFARELERMGIVVDAVLDMKDLTIRGPGITWQTNYLIRGEMPEFGADMATKADDPRTTTMTAIQEKISQMQEDANKKGVVMVPARRFMQMIGYKTPRSAAAGQAAESYFRSTNNPSTERRAKDAAGAKKDEMPEKKDEGK